MPEQSKGFFARIAAALNSGVIVEELEADMFPLDTPGAKKIAEFEFTRFKPGHTEFEIEIKRRAEIQTGDEIAVQIHGVEVYRIKFHSLKPETRFFSKDGDEIPPVKPGDEASLVHNGQVIAKGVFRHD